MHATNPLPSRPAVRSLALLLPLLGACAGDGLAGPGQHTVDPAAFGVVGDAIDLSGDWDWTETTVMKVRAFAVPLIFGAPPEGPITHITCTASGTLSLSQTGAAFSGTSVQSSTCVTKGGLALVAPFPPTLDLIDGTIIGRSYRFTFDAGPFPAGGQILCPNHGVIRVSGDQAIEMRGAGDCEVPDEKTFLHDFTKDFHAVRSGT